MKIALCQIKPVLGNFEKNMQKIRSFIEKASENNSDICVFPELAISGNNLLEKTEELALELTDEIIKELQKIGLKGLILGMPIKKDEKVFNGALFIEKDNIRAFQGKVNLCKNVFYNEKDFYCSEKSFNPFEVSDQKSVVILGDDIFDFDNISKLKEVKNIFHLHNSYIGSQSIEKLQDAYRFYANVLGKIIFSVNRVGTEDGIIFCGNTGVFTKEAKENLLLSSFEEDIIYFDI